ncbi:hypothetical protein J2X46_004436 [Nocardioides sp. BE266]|nr:hypothetical protein [Nocardioides sp. BE266]MDR7255429.1 hypothetical protein [Nocardioides sp. BE266]
MSRAGASPVPAGRRGAGHILLVGYGTHPDYDPAWTRRLHDGA